MAAQAMQSFDWQALLARLAQARTAAEADHLRTPEEVHEILRRRATALAQPPTPTASEHETLLLLTFTLAGQRFGVEAAHVLEVLPLRNPTPVPGAPACIVGIVNRRGRVVAVADLHRLLRLPETDTTGGERVVVVQAGAMVLGLAVDDIVGIGAVPRSSLAPLGTADDGSSAFIRGSTADRVLLLDAETLANNPQLNPGAAVPRS